MTDARDIVEDPSAIIDRFLIERAKDADTIASLRAENDRLFKSGEALLNAKHKEAKEAKLWFEQAQSLRKQLEDAREAIIEANNSLYGSQNYFLSLNGGPPNKYHLAEGIEKLKSNARLANREALKGKS